MDKEKLLAPDIESQIDVDFVAGERMKAKEILQSICSELEIESERILRCIVFLAQGDIKLLGHNAEQAKQDYRDVIYWAEYDREDRRVRDFNQPFAHP
jgi:hypothetical protein